MYVRVCVKTEYFAKKSKKQIFIRIGNRIHRKWKYENMLI